MSASAEEKAYRAGTLTYDKRGLVRLFAWLLLGDFSMSVMAVALAKLLPLQLESMGVPAGNLRPLAGRIRRTRRARAGSTPAL